MGISYVDLTSNPAITLVGLPEAGGAFNYDNFTYTIDVDLIAAQNGEASIDDVDPDTIITLVGDWHRGDDLEVDGWSPDWSGEYSGFMIPKPGAVMIGDLSVDFDSGAMIWTFTVAELQTAAGKNIDMYFVGKYANQESDSDLLKLVITCFLPGTMIATPAGEAAVEALAIGDTILTADGREVAVKWVGRQTVQASIFLHETMLPVCISAGALGEDLPRQDLYLSANHAMVMGDILVNAGAMVNGDTIRFVPLGEMPATFTYYHVETEAHDEILANGAPAETFVDYVGRKGFDNYGEYVALYGCDRIIPEMKRLRVSSRRQLPQALREQLGVAGFADGVEADLQKLLAVA